MSFVETALVFLNFNPHVLRTSEKFRSETFCSGLYEKLVNFCTEDTTGQKTWRDKDQKVLIKLMLKYR